ncbi:MAG: SDR family NAD(P)-dependent oxidoreductase [Acidimicrobiia bacterium]
MSSDTIVWITGATSGIGEAMAATVPYADARVINIARRIHPTLESVQADISDPAGWNAIDKHLQAELATFTGTRAIFVHNAFLPEPVGFIGEIDPDAYRRHILANAAAPLIIGEMFLRHLPNGIEGGLVMMSSAAARIPYAARAGYGSGKAAMEQWVKVVRLELAEHRPESWVVAVRPGAVDTPSFRADAAGDPETNPVAAAMQAALDAGLVDSSEVAARRIWDALPPAPGTKPVLLFGEMVAPPRKDTV